MERTGSRGTGRVRRYGVTPAVVGLLTRSLRDFDDHLVTLCGCDDGCDDGVVCDGCEPAAA